jgi:hypothetical protein
MSQVGKGKISSLVLASLLAILVMVSSAQAVTYRLDAISNQVGQNNGLSSFWVVYDDADNSGRLKASEQIQFSGMSATSYDEITQRYVTIVYNLLIGAAGIEDTLYTDELGEGANPNSRSWAFAKDTEWGLTAGAFCWDYSQAEVQSAVPLPPSALLLATGLIPLAWVRRRKRVGK